ncbi:MAG TPA: hypothetical protein VFC86_05280 [Planctomycetota bacterium]|nr:hypothetical protein [Planctomycetota bacterium]
MTITMLRRCMTAVALAAMAAVVALAPATSAEAIGGESSFAGTWSGTWSIAERGLVGTFNWTISDSGRITGAVTNIKSGRLVGHIGADGSLDFVAFAPSDTPGDGGNGVPFQGTAMIDGGGTLVVSVNGTDADGPSLVASLEKN